jgi:hypothetical protein
MIQNAVLFALLFQGKIAPVEAARLVKQSNLCIVVKPEKGSPRVGVTRVVWGPGLNVEARIRLKGFVFRDYEGGPNDKKESDEMPYHVDDPSLVFLRPPPNGVSLGSEERFAMLPMIPFRNSRHDCRATSAVENGRLEKFLAVGGVLFSPSMKHARRDSVSLDEVIEELKRIRARLPQIQR